MEGRRSCDVNTVAHIKERMATQPLLSHKRVFALRHTSGDLKQMGNLEKRLCGDSDLRVLSATSGNTVADLGAQAAQLEFDTPSFFEVSYSTARPQAQGLARLPKQLAKARLWPYAAAAVDERPSSAQPAQPVQVAGGEGGARVFDTSTKSWRWVREPSALEERLRRVEAERDAARAERDAAQQRLIMMDDNPHAVFPLLASAAGTKRLKFFARKCHPLFDPCDCLKGVKSLTPLPILSRSARWQARVACAISWLVC